MELFSNRENEDKDSVGTLDLEIRRFRRRCLILAISSTAWFLLGLLLGTVIDAKPVGLLDTLLRIYGGTIFLSFLVALCAFIFTAGARRFIETRAETRKMREQQMASRNAPVLEKPVLHEKLYCQKCGTQLIRRANLDLNVKSLFGEMSTREEQAQAADLAFRITPAAAHRCKECGYLKCHGCLRLSGSCPGCAGTVFNPI